MNIKFGVWILYKGKSSRASLSLVKIDPVTAVSAFQSVLAIWEKLGIRAVHVVSWISPVWTPYFAHELKRNYIYFRAVKPCDILKVKNASLSNCITIGNDID